MLQHFSIHISYPCPLTSILEPNQVFLNTSIKCRDYYSREGEIESKKFSSVFINKMNEFSCLAEFKNISLIDYFSHVNLLAIKANLDYIQPLAENSALKEQILSLGFVDKIENFKISIIFRQIYNRLFKLNQELQKKFQEFRIKAKPNENSKLFCVQIRMGGSRPGVVGDSRVFTDKQNSKLFWDFIRNTITKNETNYKIFVTSDTESVANESVDEFGKDKVIMVGCFYNDLDLGQLQSISSCGIYTKTFLDFHAFQICDKVVVSLGGYGLMSDFLRENPFHEFYRYTEIETKTEDKIKFIKIENLKELAESLKLEIDWVKRIST